MAEDVWLKTIEPNAKPIRLFIEAGGRRGLEAMICLADDNNYYLALSKRLAVVKSIITSSHYVEADKTKPLNVKIGDRIIRTVGYRLKITTPFDLDLFTEELRTLIHARTNIPIKVRPYGGEEYKPEKIYMAVLETETPETSEEEESGKQKT